MEKRLENHKLSEEEIAKIDKMHKEAFEKVQKDALGNVIENDSIIDKYIVSSNQPKFKDDVVKIKECGETTPADFWKEAAFENTLNKYIKEHPEKFVLNYKSKFDEYGFEIED